MTISRRAALAGGLSLAAWGARAATGVTTIQTDDGRSAQISIWRAIGPRRGIVLFSHGKASMPEKYERLIGPWAEAGFEVFAPLHIDSTDHPNFIADQPTTVVMGARLQDMHALSRFVGAPRFVAAGHSYGGLIALIMGGAVPAIETGVRTPLRDPHATCVVAFSPPPPRPGVVDEKGYANLALPAIIQTGTKDIPANSGGRWQGHLIPYEVPAPKDKYMLVLDEVDHYFGGAMCESTVPGPPQPEQLDFAAKLSANFMAAYDLKDAKAMARLQRAVGDEGTAHLMRR